MAGSSATGTVKGSSNARDGMRSTKRDDALGNAMNTMQGTFISNNKKDAGVSSKEEKDICKDAEMEFRRRQSFKRIFPSVNYGYYK